MPGLPASTSENYLVKLGYTPWSMHADKTNCGDSHLAYQPNPSAYVEVFWVDWTYIASQKIVGHTSKETIIHGVCSYCGTVVSTIASKDSLRFLLFRNDFSGREGGGTTWSLTT
jgi:hypothetical protein